MTDSHHRPFRWAFVIAALPAAVACAAPQAAPVRAAEPAPPPRAAAPPAPRAPVAAQPPSDPSSHAASAVGVVTLIAKPGLWPLDVESARRVLQALGPVANEQPTPDELSLVGGPFGALERFAVAYSLDDERYWVFGSAGFVLEDDEQAHLYRTLEAHLLQLLGPPTTTRDGGDGLPTSAWDLGEEVFLSLAPRRADGEQSVKIAIAEPTRSAR